MRALDRTVSIIDGMQELINFVETLAALNTYEEAIAKAGDDPDEAQSMREDYLDGIEDDFSDLVRQARKFCGTL